MKSSSHCGRMTRVPLLGPISPSGVAAAKYNGVHRPPSPPPLILSTTLSIPGLLLSRSSQTELGTRLWPLFRGATPTMFTFPFSQHRYC
ncbi:hypothetical protein NPIL_39321 [Nephila pilipes]|uniref:Uncharacterized protein n=1 Tax=Nephila pilipes TaxID=299642 RepID=A0A8X6U182_NEPPI|nr:hypothetical protein NPIL_39321 [Nephila pilipes]